MLAGTHVGVGHAWHGQVRERFAAPVAGRCHAHQAGIEAVLHVAHQDAVLDQRGALAGVAFVVDVQRPAAAIQRAVVDDGHARRRNAFTDAAGVDAGALAVEVAFQTVAHGFVQQDARPARTQHHRHLARRRRTRFQIHHRFVHGALDVALQHFVGEIRQAQASAATRMAHFAAAVAFGDHGE
ncbi:hypothetical protein G6F23_013153 [Rhizopus arrhizus]|nr:hypothetical protein G6F23_013153 [Rhizopus arrhizus]